MRFEVPTPHNAEAISRKLRSAKDNIGFALEALRDLSEAPDGLSNRELDRLRDEAWDGLENTRLVVEEAVRESLQ